MQNIGGISYTVDANISGLLKFDKQIDTTERNAVQAFGAIDKAAAQTGQQLNKVAAATQEATGGMNSLRGVAGNLGFQLQDIAVQAQAGTSAFVILGQQGSQIASAFGPGGAVLGAFIAVAAAVGGVFFTSLTDSTTAAEKLENAMKELGKTVETSESGFAVLTAEIAKLAKVSEQAAQAQIRAALVQSEQAIRQSAAAMAELIEKFNSAPDFIFDINDALETMNRTGATSSVLQLAKGIGKEFGFAGQAATDAGFTILKSLQEIGNAKDPAVISKMRDQLLRIAEQSNLTKAEQAELITTLNELAAKSITAAEAMQRLTQAQGKGAESIAQMTEAGGEAANKVAELVTALQRQSDVIGLTERGIALYTAESMGATKADLARINAIYDVTEAKQAQLKAERDFAKEMADLQKEIADNERQQAQDDFQAAQRAAQQRADLQSRVADIGLTPEQRQQAQYDRELQLLKQAQEQKLLTEQQYQERLAVLRGQYEQKDGLFSTLGDSLKGLQNQVSGTFAQMALGFEDSDKLAQRLGQTIVTELIGATINWGIQQAIAAATGAAATVAAEGTKTAAITGTAAASATAATAATAAVTSAGVASGAALTAAYAPAAAAASVATAGAAPAAAAPIAISSIGAIMAALVGGVALGKMSGRLYGGPVQAGSLYPVTENGKPELLVQGNRQYLLPGAGGRVISNKDMQAGGGGVTIYLNPSTTINAIDTQSAAQFIAQNAEAISVAVDKQMQKYGRSNRR